ncbi:MAG: TerC family protein, partial [Bradymonadaceae bacterium]
GMEIVLGIDNIVFITILCDKLPTERQRLARRIGVGVALVSRLALLSVVGWLMSLTEPLFTVPVVDYTFTGKALILFVGGVFLIRKATVEIYEHVEQPGGEEERLEEHAPGDEPGSLTEHWQAYASVMVQILFLDLVFSLDSVLTAVGMTEHLWIMGIAMVVAVVVMVIFAGPVGDFVQNTPSVRILALAFLILIGVMLVMEGTGQHVSKGYIYSAMGFALFVELINLRRRQNTEESVGEPA